MAPTGLGMKGRDGEQVDKPRDKMIEEIAARAVEMGYVSVPDVPV